MVPHQNPNGIAMDQCWLPRVMELYGQFCNVCPSTVAPMNYNFEDVVVHGCVCSEDVWMRLGRMLRPSGIPVTGMP